MISTSFFHCTAQKKGRFSYCQAGVAYIEFALAIPLLLLLLWGGIEITRFVLVIQKLEKTVGMVTETTAASNPNDSTAISIANLSGMLGKTNLMMYPYSFGANGRVILTDVVGNSDGTSATINWQYCGNNGTLPATSVIGTYTPGSSSNPAKLPGNFTLNPGEEVIIGEIFYNYSPIISQQVITSMPLYRLAIFMPRYGSLATISPSSPNPSCP